MTTKYISSDSAVIDFGAGNQTIKNHSGIKDYIAVDCVQGEKEVFLWVLSQILRRQHQWSW
ncbi:hypothetical protein [Ruegeria profundi]|uniref:hypothetical protein n=1 Tax=Ruegeria profundi TaxID=1685378 RepID=UPI001CD3CDA2|nr:hypothetical protein [Ruegeria profundi]MCA0928054.1 hypothetical protein [Ruegeria profundi]